MTWGLSFERPTLFAAAQEESPLARRERLTREYDELQKLFGLDPVPARSNAVFIPGLAGDVLSAYALFDQAAHLYKQGQVTHIIYSDRDWRGLSKDGKDASVAGAEWYAEELMRRGVPKEALVPAGQEGRHTRGQTDELVETCKAHNFTSVVMASVTYHNARLMSAAIASMVERGYSFEAYCLNAPAVVDPKKFQVTMSQGAGTQSLEAEIAADRDRGISYLDNGSPEGNKLRWMTKNGFGAPAEVLKAYIKFRNTHDMAGWQEYLEKYKAKHGAPA